MKELKTLHLGTIVNKSNATKSLNQNQPLYSFARSKFNSPKNVINSTRTSTSAHSSLGKSGNKYR